MPTPTETIASLDAAFDARAAGGFVRSYTLPTGVTVNLDDVDSVIRARAYLREREAEEAGVSPFHLSRLRPR